MSYYCRPRMPVIKELLVFNILAVSTRPLDGDLSRFALKFCRLWIFISNHQVAAAVLLLLLLLLR